MLRSLKESSEFHLKVLPPSGTQDLSILESIILGVKGSLAAASDRDFRIYVNTQTPSQSFLLQGSFDYSLLEVETLVPHLNTLIGLLNNRAGLALCLHELSPFTLHVKFCPKMLKPLEYPSQSPHNNKWEIKALTLRYFTNVTLEKDEERLEQEEGSSSNFKPDIDSLFDSLTTHHLKHTIPHFIKDGNASNNHEPQHPSLKPKLRPYQRNAVLWMIGQEESSASNNAEEQKNKIHPLYVPILNSTYYLNKEAGFVVSEFPAYIPRSRGGILADEMGLGKTVEILSLILCHPRTTGVELPPYQEPLKDIKESYQKIKKSRRRAASPVEFEIPQLDGGGMESDEEDDSSYNPSDFDSEDSLESGPPSSPVPGASKQRTAPHSKNCDKLDGGGMESVEEDDFSYNLSEIKSEDSIESGPPSYPVPGTSKQRTSPHSNNCDKTSKEKTIRAPKREPKGKKIPSDFNPKKFLKCKGGKATTLSDLIIETLIKLSNGDYGTLVSGIAITKALEKDHNKAGPAVKKRINKTLVGLLKSGTLLNCSRSFCFNVHGDFVPPKKKKEKGPSLYSKLKIMYDNTLKEMSLAKEDEPYKKAVKRWKGSYFDTKVHQTDFFECICGSDEFEPGNNDMTHVQCSICTIRQHAECVNFDLRDPYRGEYKCPHCWSESEPLPSKASLIVSPDSISYQWIEEIQKHVAEKGLRIFYYKGIKSAGYIQPRVLGNYDLIVTTFTVLTSETNHINLPHSNSSEGRKFRNPKRFMAIPSPLPVVEWWRICLDEAQMIEGTSVRKTAEMALSLKSVNRWCVTGTPIGKSVNDLYGLILFLGFDPYTNKYWWKSLIYDQYCKNNVSALEDLLAQIMWRTAKKDILNQISIPPQTEQIHWLSFSPVEEHFYRRQHIDSSKEILAKLRRLPQENSLKLSELDRNTIASILRPMLRLRQSCCHPQVVRGEFLSLQQKSSITMEELLDQMIKKNTVECEENHRAHISALNGLAGLHIIKKEWAEAVQVYRDVLCLAKDLEGRIKTDTLQMFHTITNLREVLDSGHEGIPPTLRDDSLSKEAKELRDVYLIKYISAVSGAESSVDIVTEKVKSLMSEPKRFSEPWYVTTMDSIESSTDENSLLKLVHEEMAQFYDVVNDREFKEISEKYSNSRLILYKIVTGIQDSEKAREGVLKGIQMLRDSPLESYVSASVDCHLRMSNRRKNKSLCPLCSIHEDIEAYEKSIFHFVKGDLKSKKLKRSSLSLQQSERLEEAGVFLMDNQRVGNWTDSETERLLRAVLKFIRSNKGLNSILIEEGNKHLSFIEATKKEFKLIRVLWRQVSGMVAAMDELNMCVMRLQLRYEDEPDMPEGAMKRKKSSSNPSKALATREKDKFETIYIIEKHEIEPQKLKLGYDKIVANNYFKKKYGQLLYLENLKKTEFINKGGENPEPCPICQKELGRQWSVLQCGHCYCVECIRQLIDQYPTLNRRSIECPMCRNTTNHSEISYVNTRSSEESEDSPPLDKESIEQVKGSLSTKVEAIVKTLFAIAKSDPTGKTLIFSAWTDLLDIVGLALFENNISFAALHAQGKFKRNLLKFKNREDVKVLLLPISSGANGLNLIEASHVFLLEPILNPAQELQAIGRVHRIGQNKPTVVHRFLIRGTVEERMHTILSSNHGEKPEKKGTTRNSQSSSEENFITLSDLKNIFHDDDSNDYIESNGNIE